MEERVQRANTYIEKCNRRKRRRANLRKQQINSAVRFLMPFSAGVFVTACVCSAML